MAKVDGNGLVGVVQAGLDEGPHDLEDLHDYMARMVEARRTLAEVEEGEDGDAAPELSRLIDLELDVLRRAADAPAPSLRAVIRKLAIWGLAAEDHDAGQSVENAVIRSVLADLHRLDNDLRPARG